MSLEPSASNASARSLDLNSTAAAQQEEPESFGDSIKNCDLDSRDELNGAVLEEDKSVRDGEENQGFRDGIHVVAKSLGFSDESLKESDEAPNPTSPNPTDSISECNNDLEIEAAIPEVEEGGLIDSKDLSVDKNLVKEDNFANDGSSGEAGEATECIPVVEIQAIGEYSDDKQFQSNEDQECKSGFSVCDMVWGKVRSHPWWPGQIYHPSFSSEMALKHKKEDCFLIAYFGDNSFAWNDESQLKPFESCFSQMEKQSTLKAFVDAVDESLREVARRIEIGMACACIDEELIVDLKHQVFENAGIKKGTCCPTLDQCVYASSFEPGWLLNYIKDLAQFPCGKSEKLELIKVKALLMAIYRSRGYTELPEFRSDDGILDNGNVVSTPEKVDTGKDDAEYKEDEVFLDVTSLKEKRRGRGRPPGKKKQIDEEGRKQKSLPELMRQTVDCSSFNGNIVEDGMPPVKSKQIGEDGKKVKSLPELMRQTAGYTSLNGREVKGGIVCALKSSRKKHEIGASDSFDYGKSKKKRLNSLGDLENMPASSSHMRAVKIGQRISQVANKMKFSQNKKKFRKEKTNENGRSKTPTRVATSVQDYPASGVMLSQLCLAAQGSTKAYRVESAVIDFFVGWRDTQVSESLEDEGSRNVLKKLAEFDIAPVETKSGYIQDSYWSDVIFEESPKKERQSRGRKRKKKSKSKINQAKKKKVVGRSLLSDPLEPTVNISTPISDCSAILKDEHQQEGRQENLLDNKAVEECNPAALILNFSDANALPSESNLITVFSQYGPLKEADTEVLRKSRRASVVFKRGADAEVAFSSAGKFNAFGPALVSYRLRYSASSSPDTTPMKNPSPVDV